MNKHFNITTAITTLVCLLPLAVGILLWDKLPAQLPMNYGLNNERRMYAPKWVNVVLFPALLAVLNIAVCSAMTAGIKESVGRKLSLFTVWLVPIISVTVGTFLIIKPLGLPFDVVNFISVLMSIIFIIAGNYIPKTKPNSRVGFRVAWTMNNEQVWQKTHRAGGFVLVIAGFAGFISSFFAWGKYVFIICLLMVIFIPLFYSLAIKEKSQSTFDNQK